MDDSSSLDRNFNLAVSCIKNLPPNGSFKPSYELMLKFYALYKQATVGPCNEPKPYAWDIKGKYKWEAWNKIKDCSSSEAKLKYVEQLKELFEEMPLNDETQSIEHIIEPFFKSAMGRDLKQIEETAPESPEKPDMQTEESIKHSSGCETDEDDFCDTQTDVKFEILNKPDQIPIASSGDTQSLSTVNQINPLEILGRLETRINKLHQELITIKSFLQQLKVEKKPGATSNILLKIINKIYNEPKLLMLFILIWPFVSQLLIKAFNKLRSIS